jgi:hypothetical protein
MPISFLPQVHFSHLTKEFGKYFSVFFILLGYFTVGLVFSNIFEILIQKQDEIAKSYFKLAQPKICLIRFGIFMFINVLCATIQIGTYLIIEQWSFSDSFYFAFCTRFDLIKFKPKCIFRTNSRCSKTSWYSFHNLFSQLLKLFQQF